MKKTTFILLLIASSLASQAQTAAGNMMVGGTLSVTSNSYSGGDFKTTSTAFAPSFGYFVSDNFAVGASISIIGSSDDNGTTTDKSSSFGIGPFARYYKFTSNEDFAFFGQGTIQYVAGKEDDTAGNDVKFSQVSFAVAPGFAYFPTDHWAIDFSLTLLSVTSEDPNKDADDDNNTYVRFGLNTLSPSIGIRYHFGN
jgi:outer membrane protein